MFRLATLCCFLLCGLAAADVPTLMTAERTSAYRKMLPKVSDPSIQKVLDDPALMLYTDKEMPRAYQDWEGAPQGVHSPSYNISAVRSEPFGNANREFPWGHPAGTHSTRNVDTVRFLWLPRDKNDRIMPVVWWNSSTGGYSWTYPVGTVFGEVLFMHHKEWSYTFELRTRTREKTKWAINVFRPFPTASDLIMAIKKARSNWHEDPTLLRLFEHFEAPLDGTVYTLRDSQPNKRVFQDSRGQDKLPPLDEDLVAELLNKTQFTSALRQNWRPGDTAPFTPTTDAEFHIVPKDYAAGFIEVSTKSCMRCHEGTNRPAREFDFGRDWYGRVRGSDGIFSWHPFDPAVISYNGFSNGGRINQRLVNMGILEPYDPARHPADLYTTITGVR